MKDKIDKNNPLTNLTQTWKKNQGMVSLSFDELQKEVKDQDLIIQEKIDGELSGMYFDGATAKFSSKDGRIRWDMPVLDEIASILKKNKITHVLIGLSEIDPDRLPEYLDRTASFAKMLGLLIENKQLRKIGRLNIEAYRKLLV